MKDVLFFGIVLLNIPLYLMLGKSFFGGWAGFLESIVAIFTPDIQSALSGNYHEHRIGRFTLLLYAIICVAAVVSEYHLAAKFIFGIKQP